MKAVWRREQEAAAQRREQHYEKVLRKKAEAKQIREKIEKMEEEIASLRAADDAGNKYWDISKKQGDLHNRRQGLQSALKAPSAVLQSLPEDESLAMKMIVHIHMPKDLEILRRLSFSAQSMLLPRDPGSISLPDNSASFNMSKAAAASPQCDLYDYFKLQSPYPCSEGSPRVILGSKESAKTFVGPVSVDDMNSDADGVWHPDLLCAGSTIGMYWTGGGFASDNLYNSRYFNPFFADSIPELVSYSFTEKLDCSDDSVQWALWQPGSTSERSTSARGNLAIASQDKKPGWLSKPQYLTYGALRAFPHQQLRKVCVALQNNQALKGSALPLQHPSVHLLIKQALYHLGDLTGDKDNPLAWKVDHLEGPWLKVLQGELNDLADELAHSPRNSPALRLIAELSAFVSQWESPCRGLSRRVADIAHGLAQEIEKDVDKASEDNDKLVCELRAKQCILYMYGMLCHGSGEIDAGAAGSICLLSALINNSRVYEDKTAYDKEMRALSILCDHVLSKRAADIFKVLPLSALTKAVQAVVDIPSHLQWRDLGHGCYDTTTQDGDLLSINILNGIVLVNGLPPRRLPDNVIRHPLYKRTFKDRNFETITRASRDTTIRTARAIRGKWYEFCLLDAEAKGLKITEIDKETGTRLELLDGTNAKAIWQGDLPLRLRLMHSHWFWREKDMVILRPLYFLEHEVSFILKEEDLAGQDGVSALWKCMRIPDHLRPTHTLEQITNALEDTSLKPDILVHLLMPSTLLTVLSKFEDKELIETYETREGNDAEGFKVSFPRYGLEFKLEPDGQLASLDFAGFILPPEQQLTDTLHGFETYLVLQRHDASDVKKIIVPQGLIDRDSESGDVTIDLSDDCDACLQICPYDIHRRLKYLMASSIAARLQLCCLFAACSTSRPDDRHGMTGSEVAIRIIRQCWVNRPLKSERVNDEKAALANLQELARCPVLSMLCSELELSSLQLCFLYPGSSAPSDEEEESSSEEEGDAPIRVDSKAATQYQAIIRRNHRQALTKDEDVRVFRRRQSPSITSRMASPYGPLGIEGTCPFDWSFIPEIENQLSGFVKKRSSKRRNREFPLNKAQLSRTKIGASMMDDLEQSWRAHTTQAISCLREPIDVLSPIIATIASQVHDARDSVESFVIKNVNNSESMASFHLRKMANLDATITVPDFLYIALDRSRLRDFNPYLTEQACDALHEAILLWLQLCVLEDKLERLVGFCSQQDEEHLIFELEVRRTWNARDNIEWLIMEVEGSLQIRPIQHTVAKHLINSIERNEELPGGAILQLNMGEGKTRIILPMLVLYFTKKRKSLVCLLFLTQLLGDAFDHLHDYLCASALNRKICQLPFERESELAPDNVHVIRQHLAFCRLSGGCLCIAPEHRLSLALKWHELRGKDGAVCSALDKLEHETNRIDIFDESDELMRHKYQLIYACGSKKSLPGGSSRWNAAQALLRIIDRAQRNGGVMNKLAELLSDERMVVQETGDSPSTEMYRHIRLVTGEALNTKQKELIQELARELLKSPPYELRWMKGQSKKVKRLMMAFITDASTLQDEVLAATFGRISRRFEDLLVLRGLLAFGLLIHCLSKRHRVNYGVKRPGKKRLAVPYRAADTPSERSEFGHLDAAILYTQLAYYNDGLNEDELLEAFSTLLNLGPSVQQNVYQEWHALSCESMAEEDRQGLDSIIKIDLDNAVQRGLLFRYYNHNYEVVNFWLANVVLPEETQQFPSRLIHNAWHLCSNPNQRPIGFSGTDDNKLLLPQQVNTKHWQI